MKSLSHFAVSICFLMALASRCEAQVKLEGDNQGNAGDFLRIRITQADGKDLKVACVPENTNWEAVRNIDGQILVLFTPKRTEIDQTYYFFAAINNAEKTYTAVHTILIHGTKPVPPQPEPVPVPVPTPTPQPVPPVPVASDLSKRLDPVYMVQPNLAQLGKYIEVFVALDKQNDANAYNTYKQAWDTLVQSTKSSLQSDSDLRPLRDEISKALVEKTGIDFTKYDKVILGNRLKEIIQALKYIQKQRT